MAPVKGKKKSNQRYLDDPQDEAVYDMGQLQSQWQTRTDHVKM